MQTALKLHTTARIMRVLLRILRILSVYFRGVNVIRPYLKEDNFQNGIRLFGKATAEKNELMLYPTH